jgi:16S rRNA (cytosine1402-N4)-methyltransferase
MHIPVLQKEVLKYLDPKANENFIDATIGEAGHTLAILERSSPKGKVLGIEWDSELYNQLREKCARWNLAQRVVLVSDSYINLKEIVRRKNFKNISGILFDLGMSSWHLEKSGRGFSFLRNEPLDMRYSFLNPLTAEKILNFWSISEIEKILREYGQERFAKKIAEKVVEARKLRPIKTTFQLVEIIKKATPDWYQRRIPRSRSFASLRGRHPATKTFQALRIVVNDELNNLEKGLNQALDILKSGGRLVVISFHSLEDRIVKKFLKENSQKGLLKILTKKPVRPSEKEIKINPRSRSAKLRAAIKL